MPRLSKLGSIWQGTGRKARVLSLSALVLVLAFWPTLAGLTEVWTRYTYSHGYLIPPLALFLAWRRREALVEAEGGSWDALPVLVVLGLVWFAAVVTHVQVIHLGVFPVILWFWIVAVAGWHAARRLLPAVGVLLFAVPFWEVFTSPLQALTIAVTGTLVRAVGIEAVITGEYVTIPSGTFRIAHSCSGLNFFIVGLLMGALYAHLFATRWKARIGIVAVAVALAVVANWIRVSGLVIIGHVTEMQWEHLEEHGFYGWVVFVVIFAFFFPLAARLAGRGRVGEEGRASAPTHADGTPGVPATDSQVRRTTLTATGVAVLAPVAYTLILALPASALEPDAGITAAPGWTARAEPGDPPLGWAPRYPGADLEQSRTWTDGSTDIHELVLFYRAQEQGRELVGGDNRIAPARLPMVEGLARVPTTGAWVREAFVQTPDGLVVIWYWYRVAGVATVSPVRAKILELWGFVHRDTSAALVTLSVACTHEVCENAREALAGFLAGGQR